MSSRKVSIAMKKRVAGKQNYKCAANIVNYTCPLDGKSFDESGYEIDHIIPLVAGGSNDIDNLQALCLLCHRVKSSRHSMENPKPKKTKSEIKKKEDNEILEWDPDTFKSLKKLPKYITCKKGTNSLEYGGFMRDRHDYKYNETLKMYERIDNNQVCIDGKVLTLIHR